MQMIKNLLFLNAYETTHTKRHKYNKKYLRFDNELN